MEGWTHEWSRSPVKGPCTQAQRTLARKERLLRAAERVLLRSGMHALSLDAVAREANTSKGGLLHHFRSKPRLLEALLEDVIGQVHDDLVGLAQADPDPCGRHVRAYLHAVAGPAGNGCCNGGTVVAALLSDPASRERWRVFSDRWLEPDLIGTEPARARAIRMLAEGAWLTLAVGLQPVDATDREATVKCLFELIRL
ncbi:TetR/AcrR family transcriptional regulator [Methylorubrum extorquens]